MILKVFPNLSNSMIDSVIANIIIKKRLGSFEEWTWRFLAFCFVLFWMFKDFLSFVFPYLTDFEKRNQGIKQKRAADSQEKIAMSENILSY